MKPRVGVETETRSEQLGTDELEHSLQRLQNQQQAGNDQDAASSLKKSIQAFKNQYSQALKRAASSKNAAVAHLQKELEELREDNQALISQQNLLKEMLKKQREEKPPALPAPSAPQKILPETLDALEVELKNAREECQLQQQRIEKLTKAIQERERRINELQRYEFSFKKMGEINQQYEKELVTQKSLAAELKVKQEALQSEKDKVVEHNVQMERALEHLRGKYEEAKLETKNLERDFLQAQAQLEEMKGTLVRGLKEAKDIKSYYQNLAHEKSAVVQKTVYMQEQMKALHEDIRKRDQQVDELKEELAAVKQLQEVAQKGLEAERANQLYYQNEIEEREKNLASFAEQIKAMESKVRQAEETVAAKEETLVEAQQQFAKKMRETSRLLDLCEEQKTEMAKLHTDLVESRAKIHEAQALLESKGEQLQMLQNHVVAADQKYGRLQERLVELEADNRELKKTEEKYRQTQQLLAGLGSMMGTPLATPQDLPKPKALEKPPEPTVHLQEKSLFEFQEPPSKFKQNLFE